MTHVLLTIIFAAFAGLAWVDFRRALILLFAFLPSYLVRFSIGPVPSTALEVFVLVLAAVWLTKHHGYKCSLRSLGALRIPLLLGLAAACFAAAYAPDVLAALGVLKAYYFEPALVLLMLVSTFREQRDWCALFTALAASGVVVALFGLAQYATGLGIPAPWNFEGRITSVYDFPNAVGLFLAPIVAALVVALILSLRGGSNGRKLVAIIVMSVAIALAKTEAAIAAMPAGLLVTFILSGAKLRTKIVVGALAILALVAVVGAVPAVREKILLHDISGQARMAMWHETTALLGDHWLLGAGLSGFPAAIAPYHDATYFEIFQYPHNVVLNIWTELGLLGLVVFLLFILVCGRLVHRNKNNTAALAVTAALVTMVIHGLVDVPFFKNDLALMTAGFLAYLIVSEKSTSTKAY